MWEASHARPVRAGYPRAMDGRTDSLDVFLRALRAELEALEALPRPRGEAAATALSDALMEAYGRVRNARVAAQADLGWSNEGLWRKSVGNDRRG